jgi:uncharacterized membrane protein
VTSVDRFTARGRVAICVGVGAVLAALLMVLGQWQFAPLIGWDAMVLTYLGWTWAAVWRLDAPATAHSAVREDPTRAGADLLLLAAALVSLVAVGVLIIRSGNSKGAMQNLEITLAVVSVVVSWALVHTVYMLRYARLYYSDQPGGVDFPGETSPRYSDFAYLAFVIGMTFQVSDTNLTSHQMRASALRHSLLSYLFGTVIVATTINLVANLGH